MIRWGERPITDHEARKLGEAALGLAAAAHGLPTAALLNWLGDERARIVAGEANAMGIDLRELDVITAITEKVNSLGASWVFLQQLCGELADEAPASPRPRAEPPAPADRGEAEKPDLPFPAGDPRNAPPPDDWQV